MPVVDRYVSELEKRQRELADSALKTRSEPSLFEYGRLVGHYLGLQEARDMYLKSLSDDADADNKL